MAVTITEQRYGPNTSALTGWLGLALCVGLAVAMLADSDTGADTGRVRSALVVAVIGTLVWCFLLRPRIIVREPGTLILRNALSSWIVPLAAVTVVRVRAITRVEVGEQAYDAIAVGRRIRTMTRGGALGQGDESLFRAPKHPGSDSPEAIADLVTEQVLAAAARAKEAGQPAGPVQRTWARVELGLMAALLVGLVVTYFL